MKELAIEKIELLLNDLKINHNKEQEEGKSYFNTDLVAIRIKEIYDILKEVNKMKDETNKIVNWIEMGYTRLNYKEELSLVDYIKQLQQENKELKEHIEKYERYCKTTGIEELMKNKKYKEVIDKAIKLIEYNYYSKNTTDIDSIIVSGDKLLQVRKILKEVE